MVSLTQKTQFIDLFCGAGGLTWGFVLAGFVPMAGIDKDAMALRTYELNFGEAHPLVLNQNLSRFSPKQLSKILGNRPRDLLAIVGGPPCQGWSNVGRGKIKSLRKAAISMLKDPRNILYRRYLRYLKFFRPPISVMENVPGMLSVEGTNVAESVRIHHEAAGFVCSYHPVNSRWFGVPQDRKRLIFIGVREDMPFQIEAREIEEFSLKFRRLYLGLSGESTLRQAIGDLPPIGDGEMTDPIRYRSYRGRPSNYAALMRENSNGVLTDHVCHGHRPQDVEAFASLGQGGWYSELDARFKRYRDDIFPDKYRRLEMDGLSGTITAHLAKDCYTHIHPTQARTISVREAARIQSFPDDFRFFGNIGDRFRQIGNAVPPLMAWGIAEFIKSRLKDAE